MGGERTADSIEDGLAGAGWACGEGTGPNGTGAEDGESRGG